MKYILDFDHTLYDTSRFANAATPYKSSGLYVTPAIWDILEAQLFLYEDSIAFLEAQGKENVRILTAMSPELGPEAREFQKAKVEKSGVRAYVSDIVYMEGDKGPFALDMYDGTPTVFVDDKIMNLESVRACCPEIRIVQMVRPDSTQAVKMEGVPSVASLAELSKMFE